MSFTRTAVIRASPDRVFSVLSDLGQSRQWMPAIEKIDSVTPGPFRQGTSWEETRKAGKRTVQSTLSVASFDPPKRLALHVEGKVMKGDFELHARSEGGSDRSHVRSADVGQRTHAPNKRHDEPDDVRRGQRHPRAATVPSRRSPIARLVLTRRSWIPARSRDEFA